MSDNHVTFEAIKKEYYRLIDVLDVGSTPDAMAALRQLRSDAMRLSNIGIRECNGVIKSDGYAGWDDKDQTRADNERANAEKRIGDALDRMFDVETRKRIVVEFQGDPRGPSVKIHVADGRRDVLTAW